MPNNYFKFKKFKVNQNRCAMKVGTDGVLLGAWASCEKAQRILDIGTGTGLIALMMAQRSNAIIDAVEIDKNAAEQALENIKNSTWSDRINIFNVTLSKYAKSAKFKYDLIVCNPPYFINSLKSQNKARNLARHNDTLTLSELIFVSEKMIISSGKLSIIIPVDLFKESIEIAHNIKLFPDNILWVKPNLTKSSKRVLIEFSRNAKTTFEKTLTIEMNARHNYTEEYVNLTKDFYLAF